MTGYGNHARTKKATTIIGIDPGLNGAWAALRDGELLEVGDMPTIDSAVSPRQLYDTLVEYSPSLVVIEQVHAMPKNGSIAGFKLGRAFGVAEAACMFWPRTRPTSVSSQRLRNPPISVSSGPIAGRSSSPPRPRSMPSAPSRAARR